MSKYTIEVSQLLAAHANLLNPVKANGSYQLNGYHQAPNFQANTQNDNRSVMLNADQLLLNKPNEIIDKYARSFFDKHVGNFQQEITDQNDLNTAIYNQFCQTFIREFYGYEIAYENPNMFFVKLAGFMSRHLPIWYQGYEKLFIDKAQWITNDNDSHSLTVTKNDQTNKNNSASVAGVADTPQNELNFKMNTGDPTDDYNFNYSSQVNGSKGTENATANANGSSDTTTHSQGRNNIITDLLNAMLAYADGIYFDLFQKAKYAGLFMQVY